MRCLTYSFLIVLSFIFIISCQQLQMSQNKLKIRNVIVKLNEYFIIHKASNEIKIEIPAEIELPDKTKIEGKAYVSCMQKQYKIICFDQRCNPYTIKPGIIDDGSFTMEGLWYEFCKSAATSH